MLSTSEYQRYSRQILLPELGIKGQEKIKSSRVLVIGSGGLGSPVILYLAAAGVGTLGILDFDVIDESNLQRQILFTTPEVGKPKALTAAEKVKALNPYVDVKVFNEYLSTTNALSIISQFDVVVDGSDNLPTRYLVNDACIILNKTLISGAIFQFEGQVTVFNQLMRDGSRGPNYRDLFPQPPPPEMVPSCSEGGVLGVLPGMIGSIQANETIKVITGIGTTLSGKLLILDALDFSTRYLTIKSDLNKKPITELINYEEFCSPKHQQQVPTITPIAALDILKKNDVQLIDVREPFEFNAGNIGGLNIPLKTLEQHLNVLEKDKTILLLCKSGGRSKQATQLLLEKGITHAINIDGGLQRWKKEIDASIIVA